MRPCSIEDLNCLTAIEVTEEDCPNKCDGLIVGVRKDPVRRLYKLQTSVLRVYHQNTVWQIKNITSKL